MISKVRFTTLLSEIADNRGKTCPTSESGIPLIATNCVKNKNLYPTFDKVRFVSEETYDSWFRAHPQPGDLIFVTKGSPGEVCITPDPVDFCIAQDMVAIRADEAVVDPKYLFAALRAKNTQKDILNLHVGTMIPHFKKGDFDKLLIPLPDRATQKSIGDFYSKISLNIENNRRMNETLEGMVRAIFKSWFVDFDPVHAKAAGTAPAHMDAETAALFPSSFGDDGLPVGWTRKELTNYATLNSKSHTSRNAPEEVWYADLANTKNGVIENIEHYIWSDAPSRAKRILKEGDTIVGTVRPGNRSFAYIGRLDHPTTGSTGFAVLTPKQEEFSEFIYCAATSDENIDRLAHLADGGAYPAVRPNVVSETLVSISSEKLMLAFHHQTAGLLTKTAINIAENQTLAELRDTLLPKLMSGEIRVADAEREVEEAV